MSRSANASVSSLLHLSEHDDRAAAEALFVSLYSELHRLATRELARSGGGAALGVTTLLHEAYLDISAREGASFPDRNRFMAYAARVMRALIIDYARHHRAQKRGGQFELTALSDPAALAAPGSELTAVGAAIDELAGVDAALAQLVDLKFFCGFSFAEIAAMQRVSERTVQRQWQKARIFLHASLSHRAPA